MTKSRKLLVGVLSFLPIILFVAYFIFFFGFFIAILKQTQQENVLPEMMLGKIAGMVAAIVLMGLCSLGALIYFIIHAINNKIIDSTERIVWALIFIFAGTIGFPVYWYMRIWKESPPQ
ncbi:MAG: hypothetical protein ABJC98_18295 [Bacteroidota bacterium]